MCKKFMNEECGSPPLMEQFEKVINTVREHSGYTKLELWGSLPYPQGMNYTMFSTILCSLIKENKIARDEEGHYCWIYNPGLVQKYLKREELRVPINE